MERYYFTFGSWDRFPYQDTHLAVVAFSSGAAAKGFREKHPDINPNGMNCNSCDDEKQWEEIGKSYTDRSSAEITLRDKYRYMADCIKVVLNMGMAAT